MAELNKSDSLAGELHAWPYGYSCFFNGLLID